MLQRVQHDTQQVCFDTLPDTIGSDSITQLVLRQSDVGVGVMVVAADVGGTLVGVFATGVGVTGA